MASYVALKSYFTITEVRMIFAKVHISQTLATGLTVVNRFPLTFIAPLVLLRN